MKISRIFLRLFLILLSIPVVYVFIGSVSSFIPSGSKEQQCEQNKTIFIKSNGVHVNIILPVKLVNEELLNELRYDSKTNYLGFGWGARNFYLNTRTWADLKLNVALKSMFYTSNTLIHLTKYSQELRSWREVPVCENQIVAINSYIYDTFKKDEAGEIIILEGKGYSINDDFYEAEGSYTSFSTCNTWVNRCLKKANLKTSIWTPFDFGITHYYEK